MYHIVGDAQSGEECRYTCPINRFERHMRFLRKHKFNIIGFDTLLYYFKNKKKMPPKTVVITFDDGFTDNYDHAFIILKKYAIPATIFLVAGLIGKTNIWMRNDGFQTRRLLDWDQIKEMDKAGIIFGAHTMTHPKLTEISPEEISWEIQASKQLIESHLNKKISYFAYPYGLYNDAVLNIVNKNEFKAACSTLSGFNTEDENPFLFRRIEVYGTDPVWKLSQKMTFGMNNASFYFPIKYYFNRIINRIYD